MSSSASRLRLGALLAVLAGLCACASDQPPRHASGGRGFHDDARLRDRIGARANLFISPAGQPFRAAPGDPYPVAAWFAAADADHDGRLTLREFQADAGRFFDQLDSNHDGVLDGAEIEAYEHAVAPEILALSARDGEGGAGARQWSGGGGGRMGGGMGRRGRRGASGGGQGGPGQAQLQYQGAAPYSLIALAEPVTAADADFNGRVTREEFLAAAQQRFDELDASNAGYLALAGLPETPVQARRAGGGGRGRKG